MPIVIRCTMLPSIETMVQKLRISSSSTTSFLATNRGQLSLQSQLYLLKTTCQRPIKSSCCKTINKHLLIQNLHVPDYFLDRPRNIILTGWQEATSSQPVTLLTMIMIRRREALATTTQILCPHARQDWTNWHIQCKHFFSIFKHRAAWQWNNLPPSYLPNMNTYKWFRYNPLCGNRLTFPL